MIKLVLGAMLLGSIGLHAKDVTPMPKDARLDRALLGKWLGNVAAQANCSAYAWQIVRGEDGRFFSRYFDDTQTLLEDKGYWWVDAQGVYHEYSTDISEEAAVYAYKAQDDTNVQFSNVNDHADDSPCSTGTFIESKTGVQNESMAAKN